VVTLPGISNLPIVTWINVDKIENLDTLEFAIKNVDSLTYYQYSYSTTLVKYELDDDVTGRQKPINIKDQPTIKIPSTELRGAKMLYIDCGVLDHTKDSADFAHHYWGYFMTEFQLK